MVLTPYSVIFRGLLVTAAMAGCYYSALLATAAHLFDNNTAASISAAAKLVPNNFRYVSRLAVWEPPDERAQLLHRAVDLNPFDAESWIQLGLVSELDRQDPQTAEKYYLRAAEVDHMFLPKWTLTNFYFRRQNKAEFFRWAQATLAITPYSPNPVFGQMWLLSQDAARIGAAVPHRPRILLQYAWFLSNNRRFAAIPPVVERLVSAVGTRNPHDWGRDDLLAGVEDNLLAGGHPGAALKVWTSMEHGGWVHEGIPSAAHPLTNGDFAAPFYNHGFDWASTAVPGAVIDQFPETKSVRVTFSGQQPERCVVLRQYIPVEPGREYRMQWKATPDQLETLSGLAWHVRAVGATDTTEIASSDILGGPKAVWQFTAPPAGKLCLLTLEYARPPGTVRASGTVNLQSMSLAEQ